MNDDAGFRWAAPGKASVSVNYLQSHFFIILLCTKKSWLICFWLLSVWTAANWGLSPHDISMVQWQYGSMAQWHQYCSMTVVQKGSIAVWQYGSMELWQYDSSTVRHRAVRKCRTQAASCAKPLLFFWPQSCHYFYISRKKCQALPAPSPTQ